MCDFSIYIHSNTFTFHSLFFKVNEAPFPRFVEKTAFIFFARHFSFDTEHATKQKRASEQKREKKTDFNSIFKLKREIEVNSFPFSFALSPRARFYSLGIIWACVVLLLSSLYVRVDSTFAILSVTPTCPIISANSYRKQKIAEKTTKNWFPKFSSFSKKHLKKLCLSLTDQRMWCFSTTSIDYTVS